MTYKSEPFNSIKALDNYRYYSVEIDSLGKQIKEKRVELIQAEADAIDAEAKAQREIFEGVKELKASYVRDWIKWQTSDAEKKYRKAKEELKGLECELQIIIEGLNILKSAQRLAENEIRQLNNPIA